MTKHSISDADINGVCKLCDNYAHESVWSDMYGVVDSPRGRGHQWWEYDEVIAANIPDERVWTVIQADDGDLYALSGWHRVNRVCYMVTLNPWPHFSMDVRLDD